MLETGEGELFRLKFTLREVQKHPKTNRKEIYGECLTCPRESSKKSKIKNKHR